MSLRRIILCLLVALGTLVFGVVSVALWFTYHQSTASLELDGSSAIEKPISLYPEKQKISTVAYCDLVHNPECYRGELVQVRAILLSDKEKSLKYLGDESCEESSAWIFADCDERSEPILCSNLSSRLDYLFGNNTGKAYMAQVEVIGEFTQLEILCPEDEPRFSLSMQELKKAESVSSNSLRFPQFKRCRCGC